MSEKTIKIGPFTIIETTEIKNSSNIAAILYTDKESMVVRFKNGGEYVYEKVPKETYYAMAKSESAGKYLKNAIIGKFEYKKLEKAEKDEIQDNN